MEDRPGELSQAVEVRVEQTHRREVGSERDRLSALVVTPSPH